MGYAIICDARKGRHYGIEVLAYVDRRVTNRQWWTSDDASEVMEFRKESAAQFSCRRLHMNRPRVVAYQEAVNRIKYQSLKTLHEIGNEAAGEGWDGHKDE